MNGGRINRHQILRFTLHLFYFEAHFSCFVAHLEEIKR